MANKAIHNFILTKAEARISLDQEIWEAYHPTHLVNEDLEDIKDFISKEYIIYLIEFFMLVEANNLYDSERIKKYAENINIRRETFKPSSLGRLASIMEHYEGLEQKSICLFLSQHMSTPYTKKCLDILSQTPLIQLTQVGVNKIYHSTDDMGAIYQRYIEKFKQGIKG